MKDAIQYEILEDGQISIRTDKISATNHVAADQLLALIRKLQGGECSTKRRVDIPLHLHEHTHADGSTHTHTH